MKKILFTSFLALYCSVCAATIPQFDTSATHAYLVDYDTDTVLLNKNADELMAPASMSKMMTVYLLFEKIKSGQVHLDDKFMVSTNAWKKGGEKSGSSTMFLKPNSSVEVSDLIKGIMVQSGNDACITVAENLSGSEENFASEMTARARELGLTKSTFQNSTGWPDEGHLMTARELAVLAKRLMTDFPEFYQIYSQQSFKYNGISQRNRNPLLYSMPGQADGVKTGHTKKSGYALTGSAKSKDGKRRLILVVSGLESETERNIQAKKIMEWGFSNFDNYTIAAKGKELAQIPVWLGDKPTVGAALKKDVKVTLYRADKPNIKVQVTYDKAVHAPVHKGDEIASLIIDVPNGDGKAHRYSLYATEDVEKMGFIKKVGFVLKHLFYGED